MNATQYLARQASPQPAAIPTPPPNRRQQRQRPIPAQVRDLLQEHDDLSPAVRLVAITIASYATGKGGTGHHEPRAMVRAVQTERP